MKRRNRMNCRAVGSVKRRKKVCNQRDITMVAKKRHYENKLYLRGMVKVGKPNLMAWPTTSETKIY
jgi:hypothetical protein